MIVAVAVVTALAVDLAYDTRVSLRIAGNGRDELKATYLAKGGVALSRLVLSFQQDVDSAMPSLPGQLALPRPQLWKFVPVDSELAANLFGGRPPGGAPARERNPFRPQAAPAAQGAAGGDAGADAPPPAPRGEPAAGRFEALVEDESRKVNVQLDAQSTSGLLSAQVLALYQLICETRWDALFDQEDENGQRVSRTDLLVFLRDWVDEDSRGSALAASFPASCVMLTPQNPFEQGFQDENFPYDRGEDRYRTKNARMDSLDELYLVAGVTDAFMAAFGDLLTVYLPKEAKSTLDPSDRRGLLIAARSIATPQNQPALYDPEFIDRLQKLVLERTYGGLLAMTATDFGQLVSSLGVKVNMNDLLESSPRNPFTDRSTVFRIRAAGRAGDVAKTVDAVVRFKKPQPGAPGQQPLPAQAAASLGDLVRWRED